MPGIGQAMKLGKHNRLGIRIIAAEARGGKSVHPVRRGKLTLDDYRRFELLLMVTGSRRYSRRKERWRGDLGAGSGG